MAQIIKRGILMSFDASTYTASVLILEATSSSLQNVPVATHIDGTSAQVGASCAILFFDEHNHGDAVVIAMYPNGTQGVPVPPPGRIVFVTGFRQINAVAITSGTTSVFTLGGAGGIPSAARGVIYKAFFTSATSAAFIQLAPHGGTITDYATIGNLPAANATINGIGVLQLDTTGKIDIKANTGACTVTLYTHGYVM